MRPETRFVCDVQMFSNMQSNQFQFTVPSIKQPSVYAIICWCALLNFNEFFFGVLQNGCATQNCRFFPAGGKRVYLFQFRLFFNVIADAKH